MKKKIIITLVTICIISLVFLIVKGIIFGWDTEYINMMPGSILSVKKGQESETFFALEKAKTDYFHIDVMDGKFVEKDTYKKVKFVKNDNNEWWAPNDEFRLDVDNSMLDHLESLFD